MVRGISTKCSSMNFAIKLICMDNMAVKYHAIRFFFFFFFDWYNILIFTSLVSVIFFSFLDLPAYDGKSSSGADQFPSAPREPRAIHHGYRHNLTPFPNLTTCKSNRLVENSYDFFYPSFWRTVSFLASEQSAWHRGVQLERIVFNASRWCHKLLRM